MTPDLMQQWLVPSSIAYLCECLQACENVDMVADLRRIAPPEALREATKPLSARKRQQIKAWVQQLNLAREVAA